MPKAGLEPACLAAPPPQDGVSANSTTSAKELSFSFRPARARPYRLRVWPCLTPYRLRAPLSCLPRERPALLSESRAPLPFGPQALSTARCLLHRPGSQIWIRDV